MWFWFLRRGNIEKLNEIELNLEGVKFKLARYYSCFGYFQGLKKDWEEHSTFRSRREPDTVVLRGMSSRNTIPAKSRTPSIFFIISKQLVSCPCIGELIAISRHFNHVKFGEAPFQDSKDTYVSANENSLIFDLGLS
ncbi:hypothetical protein GmHk_07G020830 [Glycine max]|nr:hypothetical protein GmHk_07G020830 [Glycine max]